MELAASSSLLFSHFSLRPSPTRIRFCSKKRSNSPKYLISCNSIGPEESGEKETKKSRIGLLQLSVTLTVISSSLPQSPAEAKVTEKKVAEKKVAEKKRPARKSTEALSPEELKSWSRGLPTVGDRIPYTEILNLKEEGKLKHIVKLPSVNLKQRADPVLVILEDSRVLRTVLPTIERDAKFWESWDRLQLNSVCINAYTPPIRKPEVPRPYLGWLAKFPMLFLKPKPKSKRALELEKAWKELAERRKMELARVRQEREEMEKALRAQKKADERKRRLEVRKAKHEESLRQARKNYQYMALVWADMARDKNVATAIGALIFFIFYRTVVLSYRKQQKDYEDRLKIEKAEAEERKKMRDLEREFVGLEGSGDDESEEKGEQNPYLKMAMQFMQSGARVRRANSKRLPQYMERGVDVKFSDVAGLGNIRLELEEIVKFFTLGEMYRRRGVKIPG